MILVDTHAHYYPFCKFPEYFDVAYANMQQAAENLDCSNAFTSVLCLLETETSHWFQHLLDKTHSTKRIGNWQLKALDNNQLLGLTRDDGKEILLLPGQQIITSENLELLIIGSTMTIAHRNPAQLYIEKYSNTHLVVIPWGVGKWLGTRGRVVNKLMQHLNNFEFALGDNSGRASLWKHVPQFKQAHQLGINILAGSDPLPIAGQHKKVASYGTVIYGSIRRDNLAGQLREKLLDFETNDIKNYGHLDNPLQFIINQLTLRFQPIK